MAYSYENFSGDGVTTDFSVNKPYLERDHITLLADAVSVAFTWVSDTLIRADVAPAVGTGNVKVLRTTPVLNPLVDFEDDSTLKESDLDTANLQTLYVAQETLDNSDDVINSSAGAWDAVSKRLSGLADGTDADDAVNKGQLDGAILAAGNVVIPDNPADDGKALVASGGSWAWGSVAYGYISGMAANVVSILGAADYSAIRTLLSLRPGVDVQAYDVDTLKADATAALSAGFSNTPHDATTFTTGTFTPAAADGNMQYVINGGAHTLAPPINSCSIIIHYTNNASAGALTTSGFNKVDGDILTTTDADEFLMYITVCNGKSHLTVADVT